MSPPFDGYPNSGIRKRGVVSSVPPFRRKLLFEALEPRLLLSADISYAAASGATLDAALRIADVDGTQMLQLVDNGSSAVLAAAALDQDLNVTVSGGDLNDRLIINFDSAAAPHQINAIFDGGAGDDTLIGPTENTVWNITGANAGSAGAMSFSGVENLIGAADNEDTFVFHAAGGVSGLVDGGAGGNDSLILADGTFNLVTFTVVDSHTGTVDRDGNVFTFTDLEPAADNTGGAKVVTDPTLGASDITISGSGGGITVSAPGWPESFVFGSPGNVTVNAGAEDDTITLLSLDTFANTLIVNGEGGDDTITFEAITGSASYVANGGTNTGTGDTVEATLAASQSVSLSDTELVIGAETISISGIETADIDGGTGVNTFTVSDWSETARLNGQGGNDIFKFGDGTVNDDFGTVELTNDASEGTDTIDFTGHDGTLTVSTTSFTSDTITSSDGSVLRQFGTLAEEIDANLPDPTPATGTIATIEAFLDDLLDYVEKLQDGAGGFAQLFNQLPFVDGTADGALGQLTGITEAITDFVNKAKTELTSADLTLQDVVDELTPLGGLLSPFGVFDVLSLDVTTSYRGSDPDATDATGSLELLLDFHLQAAINNETFTLDLGEEGAALGVSIDADLEVDATLDAQFSIGISTGTPLEVFLVPGGTITLAIDAVADISGSEIHLGFLELSIGALSQIALDGQVQIQFVDDAATPDQRIDLADVVGGNPTVADVTDVTVSDPDLSDPFVEVTATVTVSSGVLVGVNDLNLAVIDFEMGLSSADPFGTGSDASQVKITKLEADLSGVGGPTNLDLLDFGNISPTEVMGMLGGVLDTLVALGGSQFMQVVIPYTGKTVGEILDYGQSFKEEVLDPLFLSGDILNPDADGDGAVSLPFFDNDNDGDVDANDAALAELKIGSIQELVSAFVDNLDIPGLKANFDSNELTFTIDFFRAFGLGDGDVTTTTQGDTGVTSEVQELTYTQETVDAFRLAFRDSLGNLEITDSIAAKDEDGDPLSSSTIQTAINDALEAISDIGANNVLSVTGGAVVDGKRTFTITFDDSLGDVPQLVFTGGLPLNFGASLGDFLGFSTSGSFGMAAILDTGLTFGIDLNPDTAIQIIPPVFAPNAVQFVSTLVQGDGIAVDEVVQLRVAALAGIKYQLAFRATPGTGAFTVIGPVTVNGTLTLLDDDLQTAFNTALGGDAPTVTQPDPADPRLLKVTFSNGTNNNKNVELLSMQDAGLGIVSADAHFDVELFSEPAIGIETVTDGDNSPATDEVQKVYVLNATGGTFTLAFDGAETDIAFGASALAVQTALEGLSTIGAGDVSVTETGGVYTVTFDNALGAQNVDPLTANADGLVNDTPLATLTNVTVARTDTTTNTSLTDLASDVQRAIDQELFDEGLTIGFNPVDAAFPGTHTTGVIDAGGATYVADAAPFTALGGTLPTDLVVTALLPLSFSVTPVSNGDGAPGGTEETQLVKIDAGSGTFTLSLQDASINAGVKQTTTPLSFNASGAQIKAALEAFTGIGPNSVTVNQTVSDTDGDGVNEYASTVIFTNPTQNLATMTIDGSKLVATKFSGRVRAANVEANFFGLADELESVVNALLASTAVSINVTTGGGGELQISALGGDVEIRVDSPIKASGGGGRISLNAPLAKLTFAELEPAIEVARRLQITVDYSDPALQDMAIASAPTRFDGTITDDIDLTLKINDIDVQVTLLDGATSTNTNLDDLVADLQQAVHDGLVAEGLAILADPLTNDIVQVKRAALDPDDPNSPKGNRILFEGTGVVDKMSIFVPESATNGAITELGFAAGQSDTKRSKAGTFFLEDVSFGGNFGLFENDIEATASLGLLAVTAEMTGTVDLGTGKFFGADVDFGLVDPLTGMSRVTVDQILKAINDGKFFFQADEVGGTFEDPATGFIDGVVSGGLGLELALEPDGAISGLPVSLGSIAISAQSPNWLIAPPSLTNPFAFSKDDQSLADPGVTVSTTGLASSGILSKDMIFVISQTFGSDTFATPVVVRATDTVGNLSAADLKADIQAAVDKAIARLQHLVDQASLIETVGAVDVSVAGSDVTFETAAIANTADAIELRGLFVDIDFDGGAIQDLLDSLKNLSFDDILAVLQLIVGMLQDLDGSGDGSPLADVFDFDLPVIDRNIGDLVDLSGDFLDFVDDLVADPSGSLQMLETKLRSLLGLPAGPPILSFDMGADILFFDFGFSSSANLTRPFNLDLESLGLGIFSQLVGLSASGNLGVQASIDFDLKLGLDLEGTDKAFFIDVDETSLHASASAFGNNLEFEASLGPVGVFVIGGSASLEGTFDVDLDDAGASSSDGRLILIGFDGSSVDTDLSDLFDFLDMSITGTGEVVAPMFFGLESSPVPMGDENVDQVFTTDLPTHFTGGDSLKGNELGLFVDFLEIFDGSGDGDDGFELRMPDFDLSQLSLPSLFTLLSDPSIIVKGLNSVLKELQGILQGELFGFELPLIGDALANNPVATFIEDFRLDFLQPLADTLAESNVNLDGLIGLIEGVIDDVFDDVLGILDGPVGHKFLKEDGTETTNISEAKALQFEFDLGDEIVETLADVNLDLGIPLLALKGELEPTITVDWGLHFGFGIDLDKGFYFVSKFDDPDVAGTDNPEVHFGVQLDLNSDDGSPAELEASLAILKLALTDGVDLDGVSGIESDEYTRLFLEASLDIVDLSGDSKLTISELVTQSPRDTFVFEIEGGATLLVHGELSFGGLDNSTGLSLGSVLPSISTDLVINFGIGYNTLTGLDIQAPEVALLDVSLDLGDFIGGFAGDVLNTIGDILDPLAWLIGPDGLLNLRLPLISDLLGETVRIRDLIDIFDPAHGPAVNAFLDFVEVLYFLTDLVDDAANAGVLNFGDLVLFQDDTNSFFDDFGGLIDEEFALGGLDSFGGDLRKAPNLNNLTIPDPGDADFSSQSSTTKSFTSGVTQPGSIEFPILKPETIFGLLLGKPATIFTIEFPEFGFEFMYRQVIPIIGPLAATFSGKISGTFDFGIGYDTLGISQFIATENPVYLLNGFFLNDVDPATGFDRNEITFGAEIAVGAAISLGVATVGVEGGIGADIFFNLNDPDLDTKVRFAEIASNIIANDGNPLAMFDISGIIEFFLRAYVQVLFFEASFEFVRLKLFEFDIDFERPGVMAVQQGSTLILNIGPNASGRIQGDVSDIGETIHAKTIANRTVVVWSSQFNVAEGIAETNPFTGVEKIVVMGGAGVDTIDLSGVQAGHGVTAEISGGPGNDVITGAAAADVISGDDGNDEIHAGAGADIVRGGRDDDELFGDGGVDELFGEEGDDTLDGGADADFLAGGLGSDEFVRSAGADTIDLGDAGSIDIISGGGGTPTLDLSDKNVPVTVFVKDDRILVGFGEQSVSTSTILNTAFEFDNLAELTTDFGSAFEHIVGVVDASGVTEIIGTSEADIFHVQETTSALTLDGGTEADTFLFYADPSGANPINVTVDDVGENLKDENVIQIIGSSAADKITVTGDTATGGDITLDDDGSPTQVVTYVAPSDNPNDFTDQLIIKVFGNNGDDVINVESTFVTVPVRVEGGAGDDVVTVGGSATVNDIKSFLNGNANDGFGFGPLVVVGGTGHDTVIVDDSGDGSNAENEGNITAFREKREGIEDLVEVGVVSGLGMRMTVPGVGEIDGHIEIEEVEVVDVRMGTGDDKMVVGGDLNLDSTDPDGGTWETLTLTDTRVPKSRLFNPDTLFGISENIDTFSGMTIVQGGDGEDDIRILQTQDLPDQRDSVNEPSVIVTATTTQDGDRTVPESEIVRIDIKAAVGFFVLEFTDRSLDDTDPSGDDTVPSAEQTVVLPFDVTATELKEALAALRLVGGINFIDSVVVNPDPFPAGVVSSFIVTFSPQLDDLPDMRAFDTKLLVAGEGGDDELSVQSIDQPTYVLGGEVLGADTGLDDNDQDVLNVNVQMGINGPELGAAPDGLNEIPPAKAVANGVNSELTVDGGPEGDKYFVYLFGGDADSQINLFDSGVTTDDAAIVFGTEQADMFLLRAAVANDGLAFAALIKPPEVPVLDTPDTHVERVNYRGALDSMKIFALEGDDTFGIDDTRLEIEIYGGEGEDFFQIGQLYKSQRNAAAGVPFADVFATIETTRGFLSNGISSPMKIFGGEDNDEFVVYHNLSPLALFGNDGDDSFLIRAFALVGSQEDLRERTDVSGDAGADLIQYAVNAPVNIDGGDGFDTIIVIGTEFNDDFVITEDGIFGAGLNITFVRIEVVEVDGDAGDDRFFILGTRRGVLTKITGSLGSDTFFGNGPTPDVVSNDLLGHSGLISHSVDSSLPPADSEFSGIKVVGIAANVADDDEPAVRITVSDGTSIVSQVSPFMTDHYTVVLTRKPENGAKVVVTSKAPAGVKFTHDLDGDGFDDVTDAVAGTLGTGGDSVSFTFDATDWDTPQTGYFRAFQTGTATIEVSGNGGDGENARQTLAINATEGSFKLHSSDGDLGGAWTTGLISFDIRGDSKTLDGPDAGSLNREEELDALAADIAAKINAVSSKTVTVTRVRTTFFLEFAGTTGVVISPLVLDSVSLTFNDIVGTAENFITHDVTLEVGQPEDSISNLFVQGKVPDQRDGKVEVFVDTEGGGANEVQLLEFDASDGNFKIHLGDQVSEEMLFIPLDPEKVRLSIENAINAFEGIDATVTQIGASTDFSYRVEFNGASANTNVDPLEVEESNLVKGERTLKIVGGLPPFILAQGDDALRGATVKVVAGAGIGQTRLVIFNTADSITVSNPWIEGLDETSRIEILRYEGVVLPVTLVQIVGDDGNAIDLRETGGDTVAFEAPEVHGFGGGPDLGATDADGLGLSETVTVALTSAPSSNVTVTLGSDDSFGNQQLFFALEGPVGTFTVVESLTFTTSNWDDAQTVHVFGLDDSFTEGFHKAVLTLTASGGGYFDVVNSVVVDVADNEVALAMVLESAHSTDVVETGNFFNGADVPQDDVDGDNAASDTYRIVLSKAPQSGETVTVHLSADPTRTQRGAGLLGIRAFDPEVALSAASLVFTDGNWFMAQTVTVTAADDDKVEGDDSKSFATRFNQANSLEGPLVITGGISEDRSADLEREPIYLPGETNFKPSIGAVQAVPVGVDGSFSLTIDLDEIIPGETIADTRIEGGTQGVLTVSTNTNGDPLLVPPLHEVQLLTVDAVSGTFKLSFDGVTSTGDITYDPEHPDTVASDISTALNGLGTAVTVEEAGTAFIITFGDTTNHDAIQVTDNDTTRVGTDVDSANPFEQILTVFGNGGSFTLSLDGGTTKTAAIAFTPDDSAVNQAQVIEDRLNDDLDLATLLGAGASITVSGSGTTYVITLVDALFTPVVSVHDEALRVDEVQTLTINASSGQFKLTLDGTPGNTTGLLDDNVTAGALETALEALNDVTDVTVRKDADEPFYTIIFTNPGGENVDQLEVVDSTLERTVKEALETNLDTVIATPEDLETFTLEITRGDAKNKFRLIIGGSDPDASLAAGLTTLEIGRPWEAGLTDQVPSLVGLSEYTIEKTNPNLLVDENEETDFFFLNDTDNVTSIDELPTAELIVTADHLTGLGMGGDQVIGGILEVEGGIEYTGLEELIIDLGSGDNRIIIEETQPGATTINAGEGTDEFFVKTVSGHAFLNAGAGADTIHVSNGNLLSGINALLTVTGDVPRATALTLGKGSPPDPVALINGVDEIQQISVEATGGQFQAGFIVDGVRHFTPLLDHDVSDTDLQATLQDVVEAAFDFVDNGTPDVLVTRGGNVYRVTFTDQMGEQDVPLLDINDLGLTAETGAAPGDILNIDNSADAANTQAVLTQTSLTGLGMGDLGTPGTTFNEIQTLRIDATGGTFTLGIDGTAIGSGPLAFNISAADLDAVLEDMYFDYLNELLTAAGQDEVEPGEVAGGLVEVARNDDVYVIRFVGLLSNRDVAQLTVDGTLLDRDDELPGGAVVTVDGLAETATRLDGITAQNQNEIQKLIITATGGTFTLAFPNTDPENVTATLPFNVTRGELQLALEALPEIVPGDVVLTEVAPGEFDIEFTSELSSTDVVQLIVTSSLTGGTATVATLQDGQDTGLNDVQVLTVNATEGTFQLELFLPAIQKTLTTEVLAFDASSEQVRRALQHELARKLNGLNDDADLSRTREAFKSDFSVARVGNTYVIGFQGVTRQLDGGQGVSMLKVIGDTDFNSSGGAAVVTRMDGMNYYGFEEVNIHFGSGADVLNVQGASAGSFKGINEPLDDVHAATNITLAAGNDQVFVSSNADLDHATIFTTDAEADVFELLTGDLDAISGNLNLDLGTGRHRLLISDEAATAGDPDVTITEPVGTPTGDGGFDDTADEIQIKGLAFGDITYGTAAGTANNLFDGVIYWTGAGDDTIFIKGTHTRGTAERTMTLLNTGLGDDHVTVDLDNAGDDGFFALNTMGGAASVSPVDPGLEGSASDDDTVRAADSTLPLIIFGGLGDDDIIAGQNTDIVFGDFGRVQYLDGAGNLIAVLGFGGRFDMISSLIFDPTWVISRDLTLGGVDILEGGGDEDVLIGGAGGSSIGDYIDGDAADDLVFGDAARLFRRDINVASTGDITNPRFQTLIGTQMYDTSPTNLAGGVLTDGIARDYRNQDGTVPSWTEYQIIELYHAFADVVANYEVQPGVFVDLSDSFGDDYLAGGAEHDMIFGQLGDDTIQGDGSIESAVGLETVLVNRITNPQFGLAPVGAFRTPGTNDPVGPLTWTPSFEAATDGDDYIEGNGGNDTVFGGLGQDDIIGGSSDLFTLNLYSERPDGADMIFGGSGQRAGRNAEVVGADAFFAERHGRDADAVAGDNANIFRLVGTNGTDSGAFLTFNYDANGLAAEGYAAGLRIIPRAVELLDYTPGGPDFTPDTESGPADVAINPTTELRDIGAADEVHGESGDDFIYGMVGPDILFGDGQDDNMVGGYGADWMSGGTGDDGMLGDDGRLFASRNSTTYGEPLYGILAAPPTEIIATPGNFNQAEINVSDLLKYTADLTPQNLQPSQPNPPDPLFRPLYANDIMYGGWGNDAMHGGAGDDAVSGAEAPEEAYTNNYDQFGNKIASSARSDFFHPYNPGNVLGYAPPAAPNATKFALYDASDGLRKILLLPGTGALYKGPINVSSEALSENQPGVYRNWLLNFRANEGPLDTKWFNGSYAALPTDGDDHIFGDLGNDWIVGGTGRDVMFSGWGDDLMNADDNLNTNGGLNNGFDGIISNDTNPSHEDLAFGGAGRDVLILNTNGDRGFDWLGEFNTFLTPYAQFGAASVNRFLQPQFPDYLYQLSKSNGADQTLWAQYGSAQARNGEPFGELGLVVQQDAAWQAQSGGPRDPQAGNTHGGKVDVKNNPGTTNAQPIYLTATGSWPDATGGMDSLTDSQLAPVVEEAKLYWGDMLGGDSRLALLDNVRIEVGNLPQDRLGAAFGGHILIDSDAAGRGWLTDVSGADSAAFSGMDLFSVVTHEIGHVLGFDHDDVGGYDVMAGRLDPGVRYGVDALRFDAGAVALGSDLRLMMEATGSNAARAAAVGLPGFDLGSGPNGVNGHGTIDWQAPYGDSWGVRLSPYASKPAKSGAGNVTDFVVKLGGTSGGASQGYDSLGSALLGGKGKASRLGR